MTNKEKLESILLTAPQEIQDELSYFLHDVDHEDQEYDIVSAFEDMSNLAEEENSKLFNIIKVIYIKLGYAVPVDISKVYSTGKKYWFKKNNTYYDVESCWDEFINK